MSGKDKSSNSRKSSVKAPPQIVNFFSKPQSSNDESTSSSSTNGTNSNSRKRRILSNNDSSQPASDESESYAQKLRKNAEKISKIKKVEKADTLVSAFFKQDHSDDLSDFESPSKRMTVKTPPVIKKKKVSRKRKQPDIRKAIKSQNAMETEVYETVLLGHSSANGMNADDLQMAIALSRSLQETRSTSDESNSLADVIRNAEGVDKENIVRNTIRMFGFKKRDNNDYDYQDFFTKSTKRKKWTSKFTPLTRRKDNVQKEKFTRKVRHILTICESGEKLDGESNPPYSVTSSYLQSFFMPESRLYNLTSVLIETKIEEFYTNELVPIATVRCGCMLKNWADIPGRDVSPQRTISNNISVESNLSESIENKQHETISTGEKFPLKVVNVADEYGTGNTANHQIVTIPDQIVNEADERVIGHTANHKVVAITDDNVTGDMEANQIVSQADESVTSDAATDQIVTTTDEDLEIPNIVDVTDENVNSKIVQRSLFLQSPDMFSGCDSSANNSLNDETAGAAMNLSNVESNSTDLGATVNLSLKFADDRLTRSESISVQNCFNSGRSDDLEDDFRTTQNSDESQEKVDGEFDQEMISHRVDDIIMLISDDSNQGGLKHSQTCNAASQPQPNSTKTDHSFSPTKIIKHLSFTERLELYTNDPSLSTDLDDKNNYSQLSQLSQNSIVISDDEINYSMNGNGAEEIGHETVFDNIMETSIHTELPQSSQDSIVISDEINNSMDRSDIEETVHETMSDEALKTKLNVQSHESIELSDSEDDNPTTSQLSDNEIVEERESFISIDCRDDDSYVRETNFDHILDDENFNSNHSMSDENLVNLSVREICQKEFLSRSTNLSATKSFLRTTSDMSFQRHNVRNSPKTTNNIFTLSDDDECDEFDALVKGHRFLSNSLLKEDHVNELVSSPLSTPQSSNEFMVQTMDQVYEVRTGVLVTPKPDYENMNSPTRLEHLKKYGLKSLSKRKAVICLEHIYNRLHPFIELDECDDMENVLSKKKVRLSDSVKTISDKDSWQPEVLSLNKSLIDDDFALVDNIVDEHFDDIQDNDDLLFLPSVPRPKKPWCLQPLHIAWHNLVKSNSALYDQILQYQPVDLMEIRLIFKSIDLRYETNDIIAFFDRKCITFKTDNTRNKAAKKK